jgi:hypothetical protein
VFWVAVIQVHRHHREECTMGKLIVTEFVTLELRRREGPTRTATAASDRADGRRISGPGGRRRHSAVSLLLDGGASIEEVADLLGDDPRTLYRHYRHKVRPVSKAADRIEGLLSSVVPVTQLDIIIGR